MSEPPVQMGQHPRPSHVIAHISDIHALADGNPLFGRVDTMRHLSIALEQLEASGVQLDAIVFTGDVADRGEADAYRRVREVVAPAARRMGSTVVWCMGNHDARAAFREELLRGPASTEPVDSVHEVNGLRIIALDTSVPGFHHGEIEQAQLDWLSDILNRPAPHGTILALHHPPVPTPVAVLDILELRDQHLLADAIRGTDVRAVLAGHVHYQSSGACGGVPVFVAGATSYTMDLSAPIGELHGIDGGQAFSLIHVHPGQLVHSSVPLGSFEQVSGIGADFLARMQSLDQNGRTEAFSRMPDPAQ